MSEREKRRPGNNGDDGTDGVKFPVSGMPISGPTLLRPDHQVVGFRKTRRDHATLPSRAAGSLSSLEAVPLAQRLRTIAAHIRTASDFVILKPRG